MKRTSTLGIAALLLAASGTAHAQAPKLSGLVQVWYTQMLDSNLRLNAKEPGGYFNLRSEFQENGFSIRRSEIKLAGSITDDIEYEVMLDPSINTSATNPSILQDAAILWKLGNGFDLKVGQFKNLQTFEGVASVEVFRVSGTAARVGDALTDPAGTWSYAPALVATGRGLEVYYQTSNATDAGIVAAAFTDGAWEREPDSVRAVYEDNTDGSDPIAVGDGDRTLLLWSEQFADQVGSGVFLATPNLR